MASVTRTPHADVVAERAWAYVGVRVAGMVGADLFQYALELDNSAIWLDSTWLLTGIMVNQKD